jgi:hypothetical protein
MVIARTVGEFGARTAQESTGKHNSETRSREFRQRRTSSLQMRKCSCLLLALAWCAAAQPTPPTINPDGIVRGDTGAQGILPPGIVFSIYGRGLGPAAGCHGAAAELCGVQVLLDGEPIEVQYSQEFQINARMPDGTPPRPVSQLTIISRGRPSQPTDVRRLPEIALISPDGVARVDGPVWIHVELSPTLGFAYPSMARPWIFACNEFEVRKDGKLVAPLPHPDLGLAYSGPSCPGTISLLDAEGRKSRLPLHLQYRFAQPGIYEVRLLHHGAFFSRGDIRMQSDWTPIEVLPATPRAIGEHPQEPSEVLARFLPDLLALPDDEALSVLLEYLYHPSSRVRAYASDALYYWPESVVEPRLMQTLRRNGPAPFLPLWFGRHAAELVDTALPYFVSDDPVLFEGAIAAARSALSPATTLTPELRARLEQGLIAGAGNLGPGNAQTTNDLISTLGQIGGKRAHEMLWSLAARHIGTEQALIAIAWQKDADDLPRLTAYLTGSNNSGDPAQSLFGLPNAMRAQFADAALPSLLTALAQAPSQDVRIRCAEELMRANEPAAFAFAQEAFEQNRPWKATVKTMVNDQFPETRNKSDSEIATFLRARSR